MYLSNDCLENNRVDIINPGELLRPLKVSEILKDDYIPKSRNKILVEVLSKLKIMDKRGTGFLRIREAMKKSNLPNPIFEERQNSFVISFNNPAIEKIPKIDESKLNERQKKAVEYTYNHKKIKREEYSKLCECSIKTAFNDLDDLIKKNIFERVGKTGKYTYYIIKSNVQSNVQSEQDDNPR